MFEFGKRLACFAAAATLVVSGLVGCAPAEPKSAAEVVERCQKLENNDNVHIDMDYDIMMSLFGQELPMDINLAMDVAGDAAHGTTKASVFGEELESEIYVAKEGDETVQYSSVSLGDNVTWTKSATEFGDLAGSLNSAELAQDATFEATEDGYTIKIAGAKLIEAMKALGDLGEISQVVDDESFQQALGDSEATLAYDKDCRLVAVDYALDVDSGDAVENSGFTLDASMSMVISIKFSDYGQVDAAAVVVPDEVKEAAVDTDAISDGISSLLGADEGDELLDDIAEQEQELVDEAA